MPEPTDDSNPKPRPNFEGIPNLQRMFEEQDNPRPFVRFNPQQERSVEELGRGGDCDVATEVLMDLYPSAKAYRLKDDRSDFAHTFVIYNGLAVDITGITTIDEMVQHYGGSLSAEPTTMQSIRSYFRNHRENQEHRALRDRFSANILANIEKFPALPQKGSGPVDGERT